MTAALLGFGLAAPARAQGLGGPPIKLEGYASVDRAAIGSKFQGAVVVDVPPPFHIYAHKQVDESYRPTTLTLQRTPGLTFGPVNYPPPQSQQVSYSPKPLLVYEGRAVLPFPVTVARTAKPGSTVIKGQVEYQACNPQQCFLPKKQPITIPITIAPAGTPAKPAHPEIFSSGKGGATGTPTSAAPPGAGTLKPLSQTSSGDPRADRLLRMNPLAALALLLVAGLALNATPCVWPIIPITISFFGNQTGGKRRQTFTLALFYVLGMALMYSSLGLVAALSGRSFGFAFQNPWVVGAICLFFAAMALSMFGLFELRPPAFIANQAQARRGPVGAMTMGLIVGIVSAPCTGPWVTGLLVAIAYMSAHLSTGAAATRGFLAFFTLAVGLGTPYLLLGWFTGAARSLPRSGPWTEMVKRVFGLVMLGAALYFAGSLMPAGVFRVLFPAYFLAAGVYLLFAEPELAATKGIKGFKVVAGLATTLFAVWSLVGAGLHAEASSPVMWTPYSTTVLAAAKSEGKPAIIDFTAAWCAECKELEANTFSDPQVAEQFKRFAAVRADMTRDSDPQVVALQEQYQVKGLPTVIFLGPDGQERRNLRLTDGKVPPARFLDLMNQAASASTSVARR